MITQESGLKTVNNSYVESRQVLRTPSALARESLLYVQEIGDMICKAPHQNWRNSLDSYLLILVKDGRGTITVGEETFALRRGDVAFLDCHQPYSHCCDAQNPWQLVWVHLNGVTLAPLYELFRQRNTTCIQGGAAEWIEPLYRQLETIVATDAPDHEFYESECLTKILTLLLTKRAEKGTHIIGNEKWEQLHEYLETHFAEKLTLEDLSERFAISKYYMLRGFKRKYGITIVQFLNQCRINYAKSQLRFTDKQIEVIGAECGIHDPSYFNRIFRTIEGISAGAYRKQWRN